MIFEESRDNYNKIFKKYVKPEKQGKCQEETYSFLPL